MMARRKYIDTLLSEGTWNLSVPVIRNGCSLTVICKRCGLPQTARASEIETIIHLVTTKAALKDINQH